MVAELTAVSALNRTLPSPYYYDPGIYEQEKERIFYRSWICAARVEEIPNVGDYLLREIVDESIIIVRSRSGEIKAFYNVCRHRGNRLCSAESGKARGKAFACGYHGWTYNLDGDLIATPNMAARPSLNGDPLSLYPVAVHLWEGFILLNLSPDPEPFVPELGVLAEKLPKYNLANLSIGHRNIYDIKANWKLVLENNVECYHCPGVHPELCEIHPTFRGGAIGQEALDGAPLIDGATTYSDTGLGPRPIISTLSEEDVAKFRSVTIYPNLFFGLLPDQVFVFYKWPVSSTSCRLTVDWLFEKSVVESPDFDPSDTVGFLDRVLKQDYDICEEVQKALRSRAHRQGVYSAQEHLPYKFNQWILDRLGLDE